MSHSDCNHCGTNRLCDRCQTLERRCTDDQRIATDGGHDPTPQLTFEYTTINGRRRRTMLVPDTGGEAWRITHEIRNGEWRETGREPISDLTVALDTTDSDHSQSTTSQHDTVDTLLKHGVRSDE